MSYPYARNAAPPRAGKPQLKPSGSSEQLRNTFSQAEKAIKKYPGAALTAALVVGVLLGIWIKRR